MVQVTLLVKVILKEILLKIDYVSSWKSKGLSAETTKQSNTSDNSLTPVVSYLWHQNESKIYWKLFKTTKDFIYS